MKLTYNATLLISFAFIFCSCVKENIDIFIIEGYITDSKSHQPIGGVPIRVDAVESPSGMGIVSGGNRETLGQATTDTKGYYKAKLKVFKGAQRLQLYFNENHLIEGYTASVTHAWLPDLNQSGNNTISHTLEPTAILKIKFVNTSPVSDLDAFRLYWWNTGWAKGVINKETCSTIKESEGNKWIGKDVCGVYTIDAVAGIQTDYSWYVTKNNETKSFSGSVYVKRGVTNEVLINY